MIREILFRGKQKDSGEWVAGYYVLNVTMAGTIEEEVYPTIQPFGERRYDVIPGTVGEYTGQPDKNGKKIFEDDICRYRDVVDGEVLGDYVGVVRMYHGSWTMTDCIGLFAVGQCSEKLEVIGNIHDNPELLKGDVQ